MSEIANPFSRVPVNFLLNFARVIPFDLFLRLPDSKVIKIDHHSDNIVDIFQSYQIKGGHDVFAVKEVYRKFIVEMGPKFIEAINNDATSLEDRINILAISPLSIHQLFLRIGIADKILIETTTIIEGAIQLLEKYPAIFMSFDKFRLNNPRAFVNSLLTAYLHTVMLDGASGVTNVTKEKVILGALLRDILLNSEQFKMLEMADEKNDYKDLPPEILEHNSKMVQILGNKKLDFVSSELISIVEQHHERPDGKGFPKKIDYQRVGQLSAMHIVASRFIQRLIKERFDFALASSIVQDIYKEYYLGHFKKAVLLLYQLLPSEQKQQAS